MNRRMLTTVLFLMVQQMVWAAIADTVSIYSPSMKKDIKAVVVRPNNYRQLKAMPVVYLLHGYSDDYSGWIKKASGFETLADQYGMIVVCPDAAYSSWYWDSPVDSTFRYATFISTELVQWVDAHYNTIKDRSGRGITGLSMGGHGALYLAFTHQDVFGVAGSMSGGVDIRPFPDNWDMAKRLGSYAANPRRWEEHTVIKLLHLLRPKSLALIIDCGTEDFFYEVNNRLHEQLLYRNIPHDYIVRPGSHNWNYWKNAIQYQLLYMHNFFHAGQQELK